MGYEDKGYLLLLAVYDRISENPGDIVACVLIMITLWKWWIWSNDKQRIKTLEIDNSGQLETILELEHKILIQEDEQTRLRRDRCVSCETKDANVRAWSDKMHKSFALRNLTLTNEIKRLRLGHNIASHVINNELMYDTFLELRLITMGSAKFARNR